MIGAIVAAWLAAADPMVAAAPPPPAAAPAPQIEKSPVEKSPVEAARDNLDQAEQIYAQSCGDRAYGAYDDLCSALSEQLRQFRINLDKLEHAAAAKPAPAPSPRPAPNPSGIKD